MLPHDVPPSAWHTIATDMFTWQQNTYLLVADPYSRFPVIRRLTGLSSPSVIAHLRAILEEYGIPEIIQSDNGPQYSSSKFRRFTEQYGFKHITSSPHFAQSNGFIERMVRTVKQLFNKAEETRTDHLALLVYRATPLDNQTPSPAELLHNRKLRTTLVQKSSVTSPDIREKLLQRKEVMMKNLYRSLPPLVPEQNVRVQDPTTKRWNPGVIQNATPELRSYDVTTPTGRPYAETENIVVPQRKHSTTSIVTHHHHLH